MQETILNKIVYNKRHWLTKRMAEQPIEYLKANITSATRNFYQALTSNKTVFILECKKASPSKGLIRADFSPEKIANVYAHYASAISVLTDEDYFQGSFDYVKQVSQCASLPILCKDFFIDPYQIYLARYYQADAILLMLSVLDDQHYQQLSELAHSLNMGVLTEISNDDELERAIKLNAKAIGINNRDMRDLSVDLNRVKQLAPKLPKDKIIISESGIYTNQQVRALSHYVNGFLIGSALMSENNLDAAVRRVIFGEHKICGLTQIEDAHMAYQSGALYGGLIFARHSPRYLTVQRAHQLVSAEPALLWVGVFVNESPAVISQIAKQLSLYAVQLHGDETNNDIHTLRKLLPQACKIWRAINMENDMPQTTMPDVDRYLFDNGKGGSGKSFDWHRLTNYPLDNVILAGGLNCQNVEQALNYNTIGLDFNSGIEISPGVKSHNKIKSIFQIITNY